MKSPGPESLPPLKVLVEQARSPNAGRAEVDALLLGLAQPPRPGEELHERAELLHRILDDKRLRSFTGSNGRRVHGAAAQALMALGQPLAQGLAPEHLAAMRAAEVSAPQPPARPRVRHDEAHGPSPEGVSFGRKVGCALLITVGTIELFATLRFARHVGFLPVPLVLSLGSTFVPAWLALSQKGVADRTRHFLCLGLVALPCPPMAAVSLFFTGLNDRNAAIGWNAWLVGPLALAFARLVALGCLYVRPKD